MPSVKISEHADEKIERIQNEIEDESDFRPSKKSVVDNAVEMYEKKRIGE